MRPKSPAAVLHLCPCKAFLVTNLVNIRYLTGLNLSAGVLLVLPSRMTLLVDSRYAEAARAALRRRIAVRDVSRIDGLLRKIRQCAFEEKEVTVERIGRWKTKFKNTKFVPVSDVIESFRRTKEADELRTFRRAQTITREIIARIPDVLRPGIRERDICILLRRWAEDLGADGLSFEPIVAFGPNSARPHHRGSDRKLRSRDIVQIDVGAKVAGYCADQSAVFFVGRPTAQQKKIYEVVERAKNAAVVAVRAGMTTSGLDRIARKVLRASRLEKYFIHSLGHGVGLEVHEGVTLSVRRPPVELLKGEIITIEPGVYIPGKFGIRLETEVIVR